MSSTVTRVQASRPNDYLYDPLYTVSCYKDHLKALSGSQTVRAAIVPHFDNMFSQVRTYPSHSIQVRIAPVDPSLGQNRYVPVDSHPQVTGTNRYKYFRKPLIPYTDNPGGQLVFARKTPAPPTANDGASAAATAAVPAPATRTMAVQTLYRESEAQTDPYSPDYVMASAADRPELLALANLKWGAGLPAGLAEIEMIERARAKRRWEATLPEVTDEASFQRRLKMMEAMELREWDDREREIRQLQERRLAILAKVLEQRAADNERAAAERMHRIWQRKLAEKDALRAKMDARRAKELRKLAAKRAKLEAAPTRRDIIAEYANPASDVYLPKPRDGIPTYMQSVMDRIHKQRTLAAARLADVGSGAPNITIVGGPPATPGVSTSAASQQHAATVGFHDLNQYSTLAHLESLFPPAVTQPNLTEPCLNPIQTPAARKEASMLAQLEKMDQKLKEMKYKAEAAEKKPLRFLQPVPKAAPRPLTPTVAAPDPEVEARYQTALVIQRWLRGRAVQLAMLQGKEKRQDLINELRLALVANQAADDERGAVTADAAGRAAQLTERVETLAERQEQLFEDTVQAEFVGQQLDFIHKELKRLEEEKRLSAMAMLVERTRRMREAQEAGKRQVELARRHEHDEVFRQVMHVHQETVDSFLEEIIAQGIQETAEMSARERVRRAIDEAADPVATVTGAVAGNGGGTLDSPVVEDAPDTVVANLVSSFLFQETEKRLLRMQVQHSQQKYLLAAHQAIYGILPELEAEAAAEDVPLPDQIVHDLTADVNRPDDDVGSRDALGIASTMSMVSRPGSTKPSSATSAAIPNNEFANEVVADSDQQTGASSRPRSSIRRSRPASSAPRRSQPGSAGSNGSASARHAAMAPPQGSDRESEEN
ncbi:Cilia- and flagella-associated protein 91 [Allomyces arbusculus]|nr:Cilia- and flagella-associated protein 91 [Allomyces arbusculus]